MFWLNNSSWGLKKESIFEMLLLPHRRIPRAKGSDPEDKKKLATSYSRTSGRRTTLGDGALDFRVRNGNGYDSSSMVTSKRKAGRKVKESCDPLRDASRLEVKK